MANQTTTTLANLIPAIIHPEAERTASAVRVLRAPVIREFPFTGPGDTLDLPTLGALTSSTYSEGAARTFSADTPSKVTATPVEHDVAMAFTDKAMKRSLLQMPDVYAQELGRAIAVEMDAEGLALHGSYTSNDVAAGASVGYAELLESIGKIKAAQKDQANPIHVILPTAEWDSVLGETSSPIVSADVRGSGNALFTGEIQLLGGQRILFTTAVESTGTTAVYQAMTLSQRSMALVYKDLMTVEAWRDEDNKLNKIAAGADYDVLAWFTGEGGRITVTV